MTIKIGNISVSSGSKGFTKLEIATLSSGYNLKIPVHVINGSHPGPTLLITSLMHGVEWSTIEPLRRLLCDVDTKNLSGAIIAVSLANPLSFESQTRITLEDGLDLGRVFPGEAYFSDPLHGYGGITPKIAYVIFEEIAKKVDYIIDLHGAPWGSLFEWINVSGGKIGEESIKLAQIFGSEVIRRRGTSSGPAPARGSLVGIAASQLNIPGISTAVGGGGFGPLTDQLFIEKNIRGIKNIMKFLGMQKGELYEPNKQIMSECYAQRPNQGGLHIPEVGFERFLDFVEEGEILGKTISPYTHEEVECMRAPCDGVLCAIRSLSPVNHDTVGVPCYYIAATESGTWFKEPPRG